MPGMGVASEALVYVAIQVCVPGAGVALGALVVI